MGSDELDLIMSAGGQSVLDGTFISGSHDASLMCLKSDKLPDGRRHLWHMHMVRLAVPRFLRPLLVTR